MRFVGRFSGYVVLFAALGLGCVSTKVDTTKPPAEVAALEVTLEKGPFRVPRRGTLLVKVAIPRGGSRAAVTLDVPPEYGFSAQRAIADTSGVAILEIAATATADQVGVIGRVAVEGFDGVGAGEAEIVLDARAARGELDTTWGNAGVVTTTTALDILPLSTGKMLLLTDLSSNAPVLRRLEPSGQEDLNYGILREGCRLEGMGAMRLGIRNGEHFVFFGRRGAVVAVDSGCSAGPRTYVPREGALGSTGGNLTTDGRVLLFLTSTQTTLETWSVLALTSNGGTLETANWGTGGFLDAPTADFTQVQAWQEGATEDFAYVKRRVGGFARLRLTKKGANVMTDKNVYEGAAFSVLSAIGDVVTRSAEDGRLVMRRHSEAAAVVRTDVDIPVTSASLAPSQFGETTAVAEVTSSGGGYVAGIADRADPADPRAGKARLVRVLADGSLDPTFGDGGIVTLPVNAPSARVARVVIWDDRVYLVAQALNGIQPAAFIARYWL